MLQKISIRIAIIVTTLFSISLLTVPLLGNAQVAIPESGGDCAKKSDSFLGFPTWYKYLSLEEGSTVAQCSIKFDFQSDIPKVLLAIFEIVLRIGGIVAVGFVIYGGFQYILSQGEPENLKNARGTIINSLIGLAIAISATAIVNLLANTILPGS